MQALAGRLPGQKPARRAAWLGCGIFGAALALLHLAFCLAPESLADPAPTVALVRGLWPWAAAAAQGHSPRTSATVGAGSARDSGARQKARCSSASAAPKMPQPSQAARRAGFWPGSRPASACKKGASRYRLYPA